MPATNPYFTLVVVPVALYATIYFGPNVLLQHMTATALAGVLIPLGWEPEFFDQNAAGFDEDALRLLVTILLVAGGFPAGASFSNVRLSFAPIGVVRLSFAPVVPSGRAAVKAGALLRRKRYSERAFR